MNDTLAYTIFGIVIAGLFAYILYREKNRAGQSDVSQNVLDELLRMKQELHQKSTEQKAEVQNRLDRVHDQLSRGMEHSQNSMQKQHTESQRTIQNIIYIFQNFLCQFFYCIGCKQIIIQLFWAGGASNYAAYIFSS